MVRLLKVNLKYLKNKKIRRVYLEPSNVEPMQEAVDALQEADLIVLGPGSLYQV